jgi:predicted esterase
MARYLCLVIGLLLPATASAQADRYELGQRLRDFEKTWDLTKDADAKQRAVAPLNEAVRSFFTFKFSAVGESLDKARQVLAGNDAPTISVRWSDSLTFRPESRFVDTNYKDLEIQVQPLYNVGDETPKDALIRMTIGDGKPVDVRIASRTQACKLPLAGLKSGDYTVQFQVFVAGKPTATRQLTVSRAENLASRLGKLKNFVDKIEKNQTIEQATLPYLLKVTADLAAENVMETDMPAARLLREAEELALMIARDAPYYDATRPGQFWLRIPTGKTTETARVFVPERLDKANPVPIVFALHGAGGSENLFFDGYGDGITMKLCKERGWIMVAPRAGGPLGFGGTPNVVGILDELTKRYPIDSKRVYLIGHSMGAGHAVTIAQKSPERFAGVAVLGGGGALRKPDSLKSLPVFVGVGKNDFALRSARSLANALKKANVVRLELKEYENVEHMMIVREAALDVFRFWEGK